MNQQMCGVCGMILYRQPSGNWGHGFEEVVPSQRQDHPVVPVDYDERQAVYDCDFCGLRVAKEERWFIDVGDFAIGAHNVETGQGGVLFENEGGFLACPPCAHFVAADDWDGLREYVFGVRPPKNPEILIAIWGAVAAYKLSDMHPWTDEDEKRLGGAVAGDIT